MVQPGAEALAELAVRTIDGTARVVDLARAEDPAATLRALGDAPVDAIVVPWPSRAAALMPFLMAAHDALAANGRVLLCDLVWQTAPTLDLLQAFAPAAGREKVRPIEGFDMQIEHAGFSILERGVIDRARWVTSLSPAQRAAVEADTRGAASLAWWLLGPSIEE